MEFQVMLNGVGKMSTASWECVPDNALLTTMKKAGYSFKLDGKAIAIPKIEELRKQNNKEK